MRDFNSLLKTKTAKRTTNSKAVDIYRQAKKSNRIITLTELQTLNIESLENNNTRKKINPSLLSLWGMLDMKSYIDALFGNTVNPYFLNTNKPTPIKDLPEYVSLSDESRILNLLDIKYIKNFELEGVYFHDIFLVTYEIMDRNNYFRPYVTLLTLNQDNQFIEFGYGYDTNDNGNVELFLSSFNYLVYLTPKGTLHSPLSGKMVKLKIYDILTFEEIEKLYKK